MKSKKGFTLVEVLVTVSLLGIITVTALPIINKISYNIKESKLEVLKQIVLSGSKVYVDSNNIDLFGYQNDGCVDVYYSTLLEKKVIEDQDFEKHSVMEDKIFVRVYKNNDNYEFNGYFPKSMSDLDGVDLNVCKGIMNENGPLIEITPEEDNIPQKGKSITIKISDSYNINPNVVIKYKWVFASDNSIIGDEITHKFKNDKVRDLSLQVNTPSGISGDIKLVVLPVYLSNEIGISSTIEVVGGPYSIDNIAPNIVVKVYKENNGGKTESVIDEKTNSNINLSSWVQHGYYFDFSESNDNYSIVKQEWKWNTSGNATLLKNYSGGKKIDLSVTNKTFTARGARYGTLTMYDQAGNFKSVDILVNISPIYYIIYNGNGSTGGSTPNTTCYYGYDCVISNNGFTKNGYTFTYWGNSAKSYSPGTKVKNLVNTDLGTVTISANWKINTYTIKYDANRGTNAPSAQVKNYGDTIKISKSKPKRDGWTFIGWSTSNSKKTADYLGGDSYSKNSNVTLYALWSKNVTVKFNPNKAGWSNEKTKTCTMYNADTNCKITSPSIDRIGNKNKNGLKFDDFLSYKGWNTSKSATSASLKENNTFTVNKNTTYYSVILLANPGATYKVKTADGIGLRMRDKPNGSTGNLLGCMHDNSKFKFSNNNTDWAYSSSSNPVWVYGKMTSGTCSEKWNGKWYKNCSGGWASTTYLK